MHEYRAERVAYLDILRVLASLSIVILHVAAHNWYKIDVNGKEWYVLNIYDGLVRWGVPCFIMISGALFLDKEYSVRTLFSKHIFRMFIVYAVWSFVYLLFSGQNGFGNLISLFIRGHYHMWYIIMITGLYMSTPLLKLIICNEKALRYFLLISFIFTILAAQILTLVTDFAPRVIVLGMEALNEVWTNIASNVFLGYSLYYVVGWYLHKKKISKLQVAIIYALGIISFALIIVLDYLVAMKTQKECGNYHIPNSMFVFFSSIAVFVFVKNMSSMISTNRNNLLLRMFKKLSIYSFGVYLVHPLIIEGIDDIYGITTSSFNPVISVLAISLLVYIISNVISCILKRIPFLNRYIV